MWLLFWLFFWTTQSLRIGVYINGYCQPQLHQIVITAHSWAGLLNLVKLLKINFICELQNTEAGIQILVSRYSQFGIPDLIHQSWNGRQPASITFLVKKSPWLRLIRTCNMTSFADPLIAFFKPCKVLKNTHNVNKNLPIQLALLVGFHWPSLPQSE